MRPFAGIGLRQHQPVAVDRQAEALDGEFAHGRHPLEDGGDELVFRQIVIDQNERVPALVVDRVPPEIELVVAQPDLQSKSGGY